MAKKDPNIPSDPIQDGYKAIRKRRYAAENWRDFFSLVLRIALLGAAAWVLCTRVFLFAQASGNGMFPSVKDGDLLIGFRLQDPYAKDDVVVYEHDGKLCVGRILGRSGDLIAMDDSGSLAVNGSTQSGEILYPTYAKEGITYPYTVPEGTVFILGDYRTQSEDSRDFGPVALSDVKAKVITVLRRRSL